MANWYGTARTNFVRFKDDAAFAAAKDIVEKCGMEWHTHEKPLYAMVAGNDDDGSFHFVVYDDEETEEDLEYSWHEIAQHMADGQVLVAVEAGAEKLRYVSGHASAHTNDGREVYLHLSGIYDLAKQAFGIDPAEATYVNFLE